MKKCSQASAHWVVAAPRHGRVRPCVRPSVRASVRSFVTLVLVVDALRKLVALLRAKNDQNWSEQNFYIGLLLRNYCTFRYRARSASCSIGGSGRRLEPRLRAIASWNASGGVPERRFWSRFADAF